MQVDVDSQTVVGVVPADVQRRQDHNDDDEFFHRPLPLIGVLIVLLHLGLCGILPQGIDVLVHPGDARCQEGLHLIRCLLIAVQLSLIHI